MFNKEALNEIRESVYNLIEPFVGVNVRTKTGFHNQSVIRVDFIGAPLTAMNKQVSVGELSQKFKDSVLAIVSYNDESIGRIHINSADTIGEMKSLFKEDFDKQWPLLQDTMLENYIKQLGLANNVCSALSNGKDAVVEGMCGVKCDIKFTEPFGDNFVGTVGNETYVDITIKYNDSVVFVLYDKYDALKAPSISGAIGAKMNAYIKRAFLTE
ncbi:hypothetical protein F9Z84_07240 [Escherichia coli]|nr:hypothetical protein F9Z84_07240 [Escherichia coli]